MENTYLVKILNKKANLNFKENELFISFDEENKFLIPYSNIDYSPVFNLKGGTSFTKKRYLMLIILLYSSILFFLIPSILTSEKTIFGLISFFVVVGTTFLSTYILYKNWNKKFVIFNINMGYENTIKELEEKEKENFKWQEKTRNFRGVFHNLLSGSLLKIEYFDDNFKKDFDKYIGFKGVILNKTKSIKNKFKNIF